MSVIRWLLVSLCVQLATADDLVLTLVKQNSEPKYLADGQGLCDQIYQAIGRELALQQIHVEVFPTMLPVKRIFNMLESGQADIFCGAGETEERRKMYPYSAVPVYQVSNVLLAHRDETLVPASFEQIVQEGLVIGAFFGTSSAAWLAGHEGVVVNDNFHELDEAMEVISAQRGLRYFFYHDLGLGYYANKGDWPVRVLPTRFRTLPQWLVYSPHTSAALIEAVEQAMMRLRDSGELARIQAQFLVP